MHGRQRHFRAVPGPKWLLRVINCITCLKPGAEAGGGGARPSVRCMPSLAAQMKFLVSATGHLDKNLVIIYFYVENGIFVHVTDKNFSGDRPPSEAPIFTVLSVLSLKLEVLELPLFGTRLSVPM